MMINEKKTKFMVMNKSNYDEEPLIVDDVEIRYSNKYCYLGAWFTDDGRPVSVLNLREAANEACVNKFAVFCAVNTEMPFVVKRKVFEAAVSSALLYSCETWLKGQFQWVLFI